MQTVYVGSGAILPACVAVAVAEEQPRRDGVTGRGVIVRDFQQVLVSSLITYY